ncbi:MAG: hypothetical protein HQL72_12885 [Magnetococcales bacterium]|nr:hypothetical protein [Magnetococcales bacterium]
MTEKQQNGEGMENSGNGLEVRVAALEAELQSLKTALYAIPGALEKEKAAMVESQKELLKLQNTVQKVSMASHESAEAVSHLKKRVEVVKKDSTSGTVVSIVIFSILLIISLFIRSAA